MSEFIAEDTDIVRLESEDPNTADGWVNVGVHAVKIELRDGNLAVEAYPRGDEGRTPLSSACVTRQQAIEDGGCDPLCTEIKDSSAGMKHYTVICMYPDSMTGDYGADVYVDSAKADHPAAAARLVQELAAKANNLDPDDADDFRVVGVIEGEHKFVLDATCFEECFPKATA